MVATTFNAAQKAQAQAQLKAALSAYREMLNTFVNIRRPQAAAEADQVPGGSSPKT